MTAFLLGDIVTVGAKTGRIVKLYGQRAIIAFGDPYKMEPQRTSYPQDELRHTDREDAEAFRAQEIEWWHAEAIRHLLRRLYGRGIESMHASDVRALLDIAGRYIDLPRLDYWQGD
jgi:hypothetical protein